VLLPLLEPLYDNLPAPGARDPLIHEAINDFIATLPERTDDYRAAVREFAVRLYHRTARDDAMYFVDKTPLYHLIADEIFATFPDGRFVFLFRNPLSVVASCVELFDGGRWEAPRYHMALFRSFADLVPAAERYAERSLIVRFEDLVLGGEVPWQRIVDYLSLPWEPEMLDRFSAVALQGRKGDPVGTARYAALSREPVEKWRTTICNPLRRAWCMRYLHWLGADRLRTMGYGLADLERQLTETGNGAHRVWDDAARLGASLVREAVKPRFPRYASRASTWRALLR
jgi:hypothetical protein